jgi:mitotic spindle assembly checkpoint protein MAD2
MDGVRAGTFDILVHADLDAEVPATWLDTENRLIKQAACVDLRKFSTVVHQVSTSVYYRNVNGLQ